MGVLTFSASASLHPCLPVAAETCHHRLTVRRHSWATDITPSDFKKAFKWEICWRKGFSAYVMYSFVLLMMWRVRGLIPAGSFSSAWIRGISSPVSRFLIITLARISWFRASHTYTFGVASIQLKETEKASDLICQFSSRVGTWTLRTRSLLPALGWRLLILILLGNHVKIGHSQQHMEPFEGLWTDTSLTCAVTTLSPLVALARSRECCSSLVRLLTVLQGDIRPEGSRASLWPETTAGRKDLWYEIISDVHFLKLLATLIKAVVNPEAIKPRCPIRLD